MDEFDAVDATESAVVEADYNVAPTKVVRTVLTRTPREQADTPEASKREREPVRQVRVARWGLVPSWAKDISVGNRMFNARAESVPTKSAFIRAFAKRRCLIPADGWYEWLRTQDETGKPYKQPYYMVPEDGHSLALAGLYEFWRPSGAADDVPILLSVTVLTVDAVGELAEIHDRMPLVLRPADWQRWLDPALEGPTDLLRPHDEVLAEQLELRPVSSRVNTADNNSADLLDRVDPPAPALELF